MRPDPLSLFFVHLFRINSLSRGKRQKAEQSQPLLEAFGEYAGRKESQGEVAGIVDAAASPDTCSLLTRILCRSIIHTGKRQWSFFATDDEA
mmetsp:Transcript_12633/g.35043  ORF Transcript_12633/g.35043 Transcript_12633/m.35043 type:complete len:92 (-) Transcript_12633:278-553(-)